MNYYRTFESFNGEAAVLGILKQRLSAEFSDYAADNDIDLGDDADVDWEFEEFLSQEYDLRVVEPGIVEFNEYDNRLESILRDIPVLLYHYTSSTLAPAIKVEGLIAGRVLSNPHENSQAGVYLTTEYGGAATDGYGRNAVKEHDGEPVRVFVRTYLHELSPDPDDADISSGKHQFVCDHVEPKNILGIKRLHEYL